MSLNQLLVEVSRHYADRGFDDRALSFLRWTIISHTRSNEIRIRTALHDFGPRPVSALLEHFKRCKRTPTDDELQSAKAIFAFAFGYQMEMVDLKDQCPKNRLPGQNNYRLAEIAITLKKRFRHPIYAQFEIAKAIPNFLEDKNNFRATETDMNTREAILQFMAKHSGDTPYKVIVVAHRHHTERCVLMLNKFEIEGLPSPIAYSEYDPLECQPRAMSPNENIVNDFISMAEMRFKP